MNKPLLAIDKADIHKFIFSDISNSEGSAHTQKRILKSLKRVLQTSVDEGIIPKNLTLKISVKVPQTKKIVFTIKDANQLLDETKKLVIVFTINGHLPY